MRINTTTLYVAITAAVLSAHTRALGFGPLGTVFTYQGQLRDGGAPADGDYDFIFRLFDAAAGGSQIGADVLVDDQAVVGGLFTVELDFGASAFAGDARWLEILIQPGDSIDSYTTLSPRQPLTASPYALFALNGPGSGLWEANGADIYSTNTGDVGVGTSTPFAKLQVSGNGSGGLSLDVTENLYVNPDEDFVGVNRSFPITGAEFFGIQAPVDSGYGGMYIRTDGTDALPFYGYSTGADSAWTYLDGATDDWHLYNDGNKLTVKDSGEVGIGTSDPLSLLHLASAGGIELTIEADTNNSGEDQNARVVLMQDGGQVVGRMGYRSGQNRLEIMQEFGDSLILGTSNADRLTIDSAGNVGIGDTTPDAQLDVNQTGGVGLWVTNGDGDGIIGECLAGTGRSGVYGYTDDSDCFGVFGRNDDDLPSDPLHTYGYLGGTFEGVAGYRENTDIGGWTYGELGGSYALYASHSAGNGGTVAYLGGDVTVTGTLSKGGGSFKIDHPLDPENKCLYHSFVESPDMKNVYDGNVTTDSNGVAVVTLPDWFEALNRDFRYQLTVIGTFAQAVVAEEIKANRFRIRTDKPNVKVSWQVTGIRQDAFANAHRIPVEEDKSVEERGKYLHPEAFGKPGDLQIGRIDLRKSPGK